MASVHPPIDVTPPLCACGCGNPVKWGPGKGWFRYRSGHNMRGKPGHRLGYKTPDHVRRKQSEAATKRYAGKRKRDLDPTGLGVYSTKEYQEARQRLVVGKPCSNCGSTKNVHAHHRVPGDDRTLMPLCSRCHPTAHAKEGAHGQHPPEGAVAPLCACGCGCPVSWKRVRGWAAFVRGHGSAKVSGLVRCADPPLCGCGCGQPVNYQYGVGWNDYLQGHRQRIEGGFHRKKVAIDTPTMVELE